MCQTCNDWPNYPVDDEGEMSGCSDPNGHDWVINEESDRSYCCNCGADGDS